ncbi:MAG TPA: TldD/PmbA family protein [Thermoanaerobaculia bacterium]|jgi:predicted Zn-dependent protease|nr:TldD/PmbA family protein [Thermoanaerobaculia bacterium]
MRGEQESREILARALDAARTAEADAVFVAVDHNVSRFANSGVHQNMSDESASLMLRVIVEGAMGVASTSAFDADELARVAELAREAARHSGPLQNFSGLYQEHEPVPELRTFDEGTALLDPASKARDLKAMFDGGRTHGVTFAGSWSTATASVATANTHGVRRYARMTSSDATVIAINGGASGYATRCARGANDVDILALGDEATTKATLLVEKPEDLPPGAYDVILEPPALCEVFEWLNMIAFSGQSYDDGTSFFAGRLGEQLLGANVTIADDATDQSFLPFPFDLEGLPKRRIALVEKGVVQTPALDKAYADRLELKPTANCWSLGSPEHGTAFHMAMGGGEATREELIRSTKLGIWVTRFNYVNGLLEPKTALMTGTTRDGTFLIRDGEVAARLPNLRWTQSLVEALNQVEGLTRERRSVGTWFNMFGGTLAPTVKIKGWHINAKG